MVYVYKNIFKYRINTFPRYSNRFFISSLFISCSLGGYGFGDSFFLALSTSSGAHLHNYSQPSQRPPVTDYCCYCCCCSPQRLPSLTAALSSLAVVGIVAPGRCPNCCCLATMTKWIDGQHPETTLFGHSCCCRLGALGTWAASEPGAPRPPSLARTWTWPSN